jgi:Na+/proline symporter
MLPNYATINYIILYIFLFITLIIGIWAGRNIRDIRDYALAGKTFGVGALTMTFIATYFDGSDTIGDQRSALAYGVIIWVPKIFMLAAFILLGIYLVPKLFKRFKGSLTIGDVMAKLYGNYAGILTAVVGSYYTIFAISSQLVAIGHVCSLFLGWPANLTITVIGIVLILYSTIGGISSVTATDIFQFIIFLVSISIICNVAINEAGGVKSIFYNLPAGKLTISKNIRFTYYLLAGVTWPFALPIYPTTIHRVFMAKNSKIASNMVIITGLLSFTISSLIILASLSVLGLNPHIEPKQGGAFLYIIDKYFGYKLRTVSVLGMVSIIMSTADSIINSGSLLLSINLLSPLFKKFRIKVNDLQLVKYTSFIIGSLGILIALRFPEEISRLWHLGVVLLTPMLSIPFIAGVMGLKPTKISFIGASLTTFVTFIIVNFFLKKEFHPVISNEKLAIPLCLATNIITFFTLHFIKNRGFLIFQSNEDKQDKQVLITPRVIAAKIINSLIYLPLKINNHLKEQMNNYELNHVSFGLFMSFNYMMPYFISDNRSINDIFVLKLIGACLCVGLLLQPYWSTYFYDKFFHLYWNLTLLYCLPFSTSLFYILNNGTTFWVVNLAFSIMLLMALLDWKSFIIIGTFGTSLAMLYAKHNFIIPHLNYAKTYDLVYVLFYSILISYLFFRKKQLKFDQVAKDNTYLATLSKDLSMHLHKIFLKAEKTRQEKESLEMKYIQDVLGMNKISKEINQSITKIIRKNRKKLIKKLADKIFNKK